MSEETNTWEEAGNKKGQIIEDDCIKNGIYFNGDSFGIGYLKGIEDLKEALKKDIKQQVKYGEMNKITEFYLYALFATVKPIKKDE